jgi:predicted secreted protein
MELVPLPTLREFANAVHKIRGDYTCVATPKPAKPASLSPFGAIADELGALEKEMAPYAQKLARIEQLRKSLRNGCEKAPDQEWKIEGARFIALLGPRANQSSIKFSEVVKAIGAKAYAAFATCTLKDLEANVTPVVMAAVLSSGRTGPRTLKTFERGGAA